MKTKFLFAVLAFALCGLQPATAGGIPVIDVAKLSQDQQSQLENMAKYVEMIDQYKSQIEQMKQQYGALTGSRGFGQISQNPAFKDYLPPDWHKVYEAVNSGGYKGLTGSARAIRDANIIFNTCANKTGKNRAVCERAAAKAAQDKAFALEAFDKSKLRWDQITQLMGKIDQTTDPKSIAELQARINAEQAAIQNEQTKMQMYQMVAAAEDRLIEQQQREASSQHFESIQYASPKEF